MMMTLGFWEEWGGGLRIKTCCLYHCDQLAEFTGAMEAFQGMSKRIVCLWQTAT